MNEIIFIHYPTTQLLYLFIHLQYITLSLANLKIYNLACASGACLGSTVLPSVWVEALILNFKTWTSNIVVIIVWWSLPSVTSLIVTHQNVINRNIKLWLWMFGVFQVNGLLPSFLNTFFYICFLYCYFYIISQYSTNFVALVKFMNMDQECNV